MIKTKIVICGIISFFTLANSALAQTSLAETGSALSAAGKMQSESTASGSSPQKATTATVQNKKDSEDVLNKLSNSKDAVSTNDAIDQIQKTLLFSDETSAQKVGATRKSSLTIDRGGTSANNKAQVEILVNDGSSKTNDQLNQKQKLAYNASIAGQYEVAIELYKQILKSDPDNHYASFALAACYHKLGQYKQAKAIYYQLLKYEWSSDQTKNELIGNLIEVIVEESPNEAIYMLNKLTVQSPESAYILAGTAMAYDKINKKDQAILLLKRAININPAETRYKFNLAIIYDKLSDYVNAAKYYQEVISDYISSEAPDSTIPIDHVKQRFDFIKDKI